MLRESKGELANAFASSSSTGRRFDAICAGRAAPPSAPNRRGRRSPDGSDKKRLVPAPPEGGPAPVTERESTREHAYPGWKMPGFGLTGPGQLDTDETRTNLGPLTCQSPDARELVSGCRLVNQPVAVSGVVSRPCSCRDAGAVQLGSVSR